MEFLSSCELVKNNQKLQNNQRNLEQNSFEQNV